MSLKVVHFESTDAVLVRIDLVVGEDISAPAAGDFSIGVLRGGMLEVEEDVSAAKEDFLGEAEEIFEAGEDIVEAAGFLEEGDIHSEGEGIDISVEERIGISE